MHHELRRANVLLMPTISYQVYETSHTNTRLNADIALILQDVDSDLLDTIGKLIFGPNLQRTWRPRVPSRAPIGWGPSENKGVRDVRHLKVVRPTCRLALSLPHPWLHVLLVLLLF